MTLLPRKTSSTTSRWRSSQFKLMIRLKTKEISKFRKLGKSSEGKKIHTIDWSITSRPIAESIFGLITSRTHPTSNFRRMKQKKFLCRMKDTIPFSNLSTVHPTEFGKNTAVIFKEKRTNQIQPSNNENKTNWKQDMISGLYLDASLIVIMFKKGKFYLPQEFLVPLKHVDVVRRTHTGLDVFQECQTDDFWNGDGDRILSWQWTGFTLFILLSNTPLRGYMWSEGGIDEDSSNVQARWPEIWSGISQKSQQKEKQHWAEEEPKVDDARKLRGIYYMVPEDKEFNKTLKMLEKLEVHMDSAMPRKLRKTSHPERRRGSTKRELAMNIGQGEILCNHHNKNKGKTPKEGSSP